MLPPFSKRRDDPADKAFAEGRRPGDRNQLGPYPSAIGSVQDFKNEFISQRFNPDKKDFWQQAFSQETATQSQAKLNIASLSDEPNFPEPLNTLARDFLMKYSGPGGAIDRELIDPGSAITKDTIAPLTREPVALRIGDRDPNVVGKFPGSGGVSV